MMKKWASVSLLIFLVSFSVLAEPTEEDIYAPTTFFITHEQFMNLTPAEQITYVKKVKEVIVEMAKTFPYLAEKMNARSSLLRQLWVLNMPDAYSEEKPSDRAAYSFVSFSLGEADKYLKEVKNAHPAKMTEQEKQVAISNYRQAMYWTSMAAIQLEPLPKENFQTLRNKLKKDINSTANQIANYEKKIISLSKTKDDSEFRTVRDNYLKPSLEGKVSSTTPIHGVEYDLRHTLPTSLPKEEPTKEAEISKPPAPSGAEQPLPKTETEGSADSPTLYRCIYAGFVIKKDPCIAPRTLPWDLQPLDEKTFVCPQKTIMCNPLIFGLQSDCDWSTLPEKCWNSAKPHCVKPGLYATKNCTDASNNNRSLQGAVELIKANPEIFNEFGVSFASLCHKDLIDFNSYPRKRTAKNIQRTKNDIKKTCEVAQARMSEIKKRYYLTPPEVESKPAGPAVKTKSLTTVPPKAPTGKDLLMNKPNSGKK